jgi:hypothetical protein
MMNPASSSSRDGAVQRFWGAYRACVEEQRVNPKQAGFYVRWVQAFIDHQPGKRLAQRDGQDVEGFLRWLGQQPRVEAWQVQQAERALKILYEAFLPRYRPAAPTTNGAPGGRALPQAQEANGRGNRSAAAGFRDRVVPGEVERRYPELLEGLRKEVRRRHYSYRTETAYADWLRRFVAFHGYCDPRSLDATAVREYLDYLAVTRGVAASTQNQALNALVFVYREVLRQALDDFSDFERAKRPQRVPEVLSREEVTKQIYTHVLNRPGLNVKSPLDAISV